MGTLTLCVSIEHVTSKTSGEKRRKKEKNDDGKVNEQREKETIIMVMC